MPRMPLIRVSEFPYHVRARTNNKEWFHIHMEDCWAIFEKQLAVICKKYGVKIGSFVLMSNHFHMIIWTPNENLDEVMHYLLRQVSKEMNKKSGRINHVFGGPYKWTIVDNDRYLLHVYRYNYQNPIRTGQASTVQEYRYSTFFHLFRNIKTLFPFCDDLITNCCLLDTDLNKKTIWLNEIYEEKQSRAIKMALRKNRFKYPLHKRFLNSVKQLEVPKSMAYQVALFIKDF